MIHDWEGERRAAEADAFERWCEANDVDPDDEGAFRAFERASDEALAEALEARAEARREARDDYDDRW